MPAAFKDSSYPVQDVSAKSGSEDAEGQTAVASASHYTDEWLGRVAIDAASAIMAGSAVAPLVTIIDRAVAEASSGRATILQSVRTSIATLALRPHHFVTHRVFALMMLLYGSTYFTANTIDTLHSRRVPKEEYSAHATSNGLAKFGAVSAVNMSLSLYKDSQCAKIFGTISKRALPPASYAVMMVRDSMTIFASFNLPPLIAPLLPVSLDHTIGRLSIAQLAIPAMMQPINTPLHLLALDLYNRGQRLAFRERLRKVRAEWPAASLMRMCRVIPPFGFGNVLNRGIRDRLITRMGHG